MGTGDVMTTQDDDRIRFHVSLPFFHVFFFFLSPTQWNHEQCGHAKAYSTVMLWGNSQESSMPSCQSGLERNINRSTVAIMVTLFFFSQNTLNLTALVVFFSLIIHASSFRILNVCFFYSLVRPYSKTTCRNCLWASCSFCCFPALSVVPGDCLDFADKGTGIRLVGEATLAFCKGIQTKNKRRNKTKEGEKNTHHIGSMKNQGTDRSRT